MLKKDKTVVKTTTFPAVSPLSMGLVYGSKEISRKEDTSFTTTQELQSMVSSPPQNSASDIQSLISYAMQEGVLRRRDHLTLATAMLSDATLTARDRQHINQVFDGLRTGRMRLAD